MSGSNPNYSQQLNANCPPGTRPYTGTGRPFARTDFFPSSLESGRPLSPLTDISGNGYGRTSNQAHYKKLSQRENRFNLEQEMARNKEYALGRLRAEQSAACAAPTFPSYERSNQNMGISRGKLMDLKAEIQRGKNQEVFIHILKN